MKAAIQAYEPNYRPVVTAPANDRVTLKVIERPRRTTPRFVVPTIDARLFHAWRP